MLKLFPKNFSNLSVKISVFAILITLTMSVYGQRTLGKISLLSGGITKSVLQNESADLDQCANGDTIATHIPCAGAGSGSDGWTNGNVNGQKAHWAETQSLPYRMRFTGLTLGQHTVKIGYDVLKGTAHAIDYLTSFDNTETLALGNNPCDTVSGCDINSPVTAPIPLDPTITLPAVVAGRAALPGNLMTLYGGNFTGIATPVSLPGPGDNSEERTVVITFNATVSNPVLAWGGHVAWQGEWGAGLSAGSISGSPYHMRLKDLDGSGGNQDRSLSADAVAIPGKLTIVKQVLFPLSVSVSFNFTGTGAQLSGFSLAPTTDISGTTSSAKTVFALTTNLSGLSADQRVVQESQTLPQGWKVTNLGCFNNITQDTSTHISLAGTNISQGIAIATITPTEGDDIQCTFTNSIVTAANANITGRVTTRTGYGISGAQVNLQDATTGASVTVLTNPFGYYTISNVPVNDFCIVSVSSKRYTFSSNSLSFVLNDNLSGVNFVAN